MFRSEDLTSANQVNCSIENCSKSGMYNTGNIDLDGMNLNIITTDLNESKEYRDTCIDFNSNSNYCEEKEGPFKERDTFLIGNDGFNIFSVSNKNVVIAYYPKRISQGNFTVGFVMKSHYYETLNFKTTLSVNSTETETRIITLKPNEEIISKFNVTLSVAGSHKVKISATPTTINRGNEIYFWIERI
jgi:hypothetical protein